MAKDKSVIRFGVGTAYEPFAHVWRVWTHKSETYLTWPGLGGFYKISLHSGGVWVGAFTAESGVQDDGNRRTHRWTAAPEFAAGWLIGCYLVVPRADDRHDLPVTLQSDLGSVRWLPTPAVGSAVYCWLLFAADSMADASALGTQYVVGSLPLDDGRTVWIVAQERPIPDAERATYISVRDHEVGGIGLTGPPERGKIGMSAAWIGTEGSVPRLVQIPLASHNFVVEPGKPPVPGGRLNRQGITEHIAYRKGPRKP